MNDDLPQHVLFWPWAFIVGLPVAIVLWCFRSRFEAAFAGPLVISVAIAFAIIPTVIEHGTGPLVVYAFPLFFTAPLTLSAVAALPPLLLGGGLVFWVLSWTRKKTKNA